MQLADLHINIKKALKEGNIDSFSIDSTLILCHALNINKLTLITKGDMDISPEDEKTALSFLERRLRHEPMQYITGKAEFMGLDFEVDKSTLIPRGDTENIVEFALETIKEKGYTTLLDMCTGSGAIAVSCVKYSGVKATACDISEKALLKAEINARKNNTPVEFVKSDIFSNIKHKYDIIISNPPYIKREEIPTLMEDVKNYEPLSALDGGENGLFFYEEITKKAPSHLNKGGCLLYEIGYDQRREVESILHKNGFKDIGSFKDLAGLDRGVYGYL